MNGLLPMMGLVAWCAMPMIGLADDEDHERARRLVRSGEIRSLESILRSHGKRLEGRLLEVELERKNGLFLYEIELVNGQGRVVELEFDARTGKLLREKRED
ncbi:MAG: PepSY domain-containing protein [Magnetococcales bacterium]|nr:PepSY domain-containing protein [Magnetococcales bacterium]